MEVKPAITLSEHMTKAVNARWAKTNKEERSKFGKFVSSHRANVKAKAKVKKTK
jgi:hypothetical protein